MPLDELVDAPETGDPRVRAKPIVRHGRTYIPLTRRPGGLQAFKVIFPKDEQLPSTLATHEGYEWLYILSGRLRLVLGDQDLVLEGGRGGRVRHPYAALARQPGPAPGRAARALRAPGRADARPHLRTRSAGDRQHRRTPRHLARGARARGPPGRGGPADLHPRRRRPGRLDRARPARGARPAAAQRGERARARRTGRAGPDRPAGQAAGRAARDAVVHVRDAGGAARDVGRRDPLRRAQGRADPSAGRRAGRGPRRGARGSS